MSTVKAAFYDAFERLQHCTDFEEVKNKTDWCLKCVEVENGTATKEQIISLLNECQSFSIGDGVLEFTISKTQAELDEMLEENKAVREYTENQIKKWYNASLENKDQIIYLQRTRGGLSRDFWSSVDK